MLGAGYRAVLLIPKKVKVLGFTFILTHFLTFSNIPSSP